ncbi:hypothetical protein Tco_0781048 [Tanacetum coccineum]
MAISYAASRRLRKLRPEEAWETIEDLAKYEEEGWNEPIFFEKGSPDYVDANLEQELESMEHQVESLMRSEMLLHYERGFTSPKRPYQEEFKGNILKLIDDQEDQIKQLEEDPGDGVRINPDGVARPAPGKLLSRLYLIRRSLEVLRKFHWTTFGGRFSQKAHLLEDKQILSVGVFDEVSFYTLFRDDKGKGKRIMEDTKQNLIGIKELDDHEERINNVEAVLFKLRDIRLRQKEVIIISDDDTSLDAPVIADGDSFSDSSNDLYDYMSEEEPKPLDVPK